MSLELWSPGGVTMSNRVTEILSEVKDRFGIAFTEVHTGGGCMALEARLESGHWIVATDEGLMAFRHRIEWEDENEGRPAGWSIGIYPHGGDETDWSGQESIFDHIDLDAVAGDLPDTIAVALGGFMVSQLERQLESGADR